MCGSLKLENIDFDNSMVEEEKMSRGVEMEDMEVDTARLPKEGGVGESSFSLSNQLEFYQLMHSTPAA